MGAVGAIAPTVFESVGAKIESSDRDWCFYGKDQISIRV